MLESVYQLRQVMDQAIGLYFSIEGKNGFDESKAEVCFSLVCGNYPDEELDLDEDVHQYLQRKQLAKGKTSFILRSIKEDNDILANPSWLGGSHETEGESDADADAKAVVQFETLVHSIPNSPEPPAQSSNDHPDVGLAEATGSVRHTR